ncbi:MAG TPA: SWIM zinc finger family protein [Phycisphaerae bacterium]|nr:SWIM zinc finger family protein [Phycisphaerae bacterium]
MHIREMDGRSRIDPDSGSLVMYRRFAVQREGGSAHLVEVEVSHDGAPQSERCDCRGWQFRRACRHVAAVYAAGVLGVEVEA